MTHNHESLADFIAWLEAQPADSHPCAGAASCCPLEAWAAAEGVPQLAQYQDFYHFVRGATVWPAPPWQQTIVQWADGVRHARWAQLRAGEILARAQKIAGDKGPEA